MKMKKCLSLVLAAAMTFTLASCGGNGGSGGGEGGESKVSLNVSVPDADNSYRDRRKFCVIDVPRQYENLRLSQE